MEQPTPALTEPTDTGSNDAQQTGSTSQDSSIYNPLGADRGPTPEEIEGWRRHHYDTMIREAAERGEPTEHGSLAEHVAASGTGAVYMAWTDVMKRAAREDMAPDDAAGLCARAMVASMTGQSFDAANEPLPSIERAERATAPSGPPSATDEHGGPVEADLVELGIRYEQVRMAASDAGKQNRTYTAEKAQIEREFLAAMVDSGQMHISLIMPGSGENRVLTPMPKVWPKVLPNEEAPVDENGEHPTFTEAERIEALRAARLDHLIVSKIDTKGLNELFEGYVSDEDMPEALRKVYTITRQWSVSSVKGRSGRVRPPTAAEIAQGKAPSARR